MGKNILRTMILLVAVFVLILSAGTAGAYDIQRIYARVSATAGETLAQGDVVCIKSSDGKAYKAQANSATLRPAIGIVGKGAASSGTVEIVTRGIFGGFSSLTKGAPGYLDTTAGAVTQTAPSNYMQPVAIAISATQYNFEFSPGISNIQVDSTAHAATNQTTDGTSITVPAGTFTAGKVLRITAGGTISGGLAVKNVILYIDDAAIITTATAASTTGSWQAEFLIQEYTDTAHQFVSGRLLTSAAADALGYYATDTTDFSTAKTIKIQVVSGNAGDTITQTFGIVEFLP